MKLGRVFHFDAAHRLMDARQEQCEELHGHTYKVEVVVDGPVQENGMVMDFADLKKVVREVLDELDHKDLNKKFDNPTAEHICRWVHDQLQAKLESFESVSLVSVRLWEGEGKWVEM